MKTRKTHYKIRNTESNGKQDKTERDRMKPTEQERDKTRNNETTPGKAGDKPRKKGTHNEKEQDKT